MVLTIQKEHFPKQVWWPLYETYSILCDVRTEVLYIIPINIRSVKIVLNNRYTEEPSSQPTEIPAFVFKDQSVTKSIFLYCVNWTQCRDTL